MRSISGLVPRLRTDCSLASSGCCSRRATQIVSNPMPKPTNERNPSSRIASESVRVKNANPSTEENRAPIADRRPCRGQSPVADRTAKSPDTCCCRRATRPETPVHRQRSRRRVTGRHRFRTTRTATSTPRPGPRPGYTRGLTRTSHRFSSRGHRGAVPSGVFDPRGAESYSTVRRAHRGEKTLLGGVYRRPQQEAGENCGLRSCGSLSNNRGRRSPSLTRPQRSTQRHSLARVASGIRHRLIRDSGLSSVRHRVLA